MGWMIFGLITLFAVIVLYSNKDKSREWNRAFEVEHGEILARGRGSLKGNDHPLITKDLYMFFFVTEEKLVIGLEKQLAISLLDVRAETTTATQASAMGIIAFGMAGMAAKERVCILRFDDKESGEQYTSVFTGDMEKVAEAINRQRYRLLTTKREIMQNE